MSKLGYVLLFPLLALSFLSGKGADAGTKVPTDQLGLTAEQSIDVDAIQARRVARSKIDRIKSLRSQAPRPQRVRHSRPRQISLGQWGSPSQGAMAPTLSKSGGPASSLVAGPTPIILINDMAADTVTQGGYLVITVAFSDSAASGELAFWIDTDQNGILDPNIDFNIEDGIIINDGDFFFNDDFSDEDSTLGVFQITLGGGDEEGFSRVAPAQFLVEVTDPGGSDTAWVYIKPLVSTNSFAGVVTPVVANVIIGAFPTMDDTGGPDGPDGPGEALWMTLTDSSGNYQLAVPDTGYYDVFAFDFLGVQDGLIADTSYHMVAAAANRIDLDFTFIEPTSFIEGFVTDNSGFPVTGVLVFAGGGPGVEQEGSTDAIGFYSIGVTPGHYRVELDEDIIPDYMSPEEQEVEVLDGESVTANFTLYVADATISGRVTLNGAPLAGIEIGARGYPVGRTFGVSGFDGIYTLLVSSEVDFEGYSLRPHNQPDGTFFANQLWNIPPGANGVDIDFVIAAGGIFGAVTAAGSLDTLFNVSIEVEDTTGNRFPGGVDFETGEYSIPLPDGVYKVFAWAEGFFPFESDSTVTVAGSFVPFDIELDSVVTDAAIEGVITDVNGGFSLGGVEVWVWNPMLDYGDHTFTDSSGFYHIDIPNGEYEIWTFLEGYREAYDLVTVPPGPTVTKDFALEQFTFEAPYITRIIDRGQSDHADDEPDQGGWVYLEFDGGGTQEGPFVGWSIWRVPGPDYFPEQMVSVGFVNFHGEPHYTALVSTRADSGAAYPTPEEYLSHYVVTGYTGGDLFEWFDSDPQAGYSVDNIVPGVPAGVQIIGIENGVQLSWETSTDADFQYYAVYRSEVAGSYGADPYAAVSGTSYDDTQLLIGTTYYVVTAVDANGNESEYSLEKNSVTLAIDGQTGMPTEYALEGNYPNPFNPSTTIRYQLPAAGRVSIKVFDLTGKQVKTLVNEAMPAGYYRAVWDGRDARGAAVATGVYFYRITVDNAFVQTRKMVLMK